MSQVALARAAGVCHSAYNALETMRDSPLGASGEPREIARALCEFHGVGLDELFPPSVLRVERNSATVMVDASELAPMVSTFQSYAQLGPESAAINAQREELVRSLVSDSVSSLTPRQQQVVRLRFGLGGNEPMTRQEIADALELSVSTITLVERQALWRIRCRNGKRGRMLAALAEEGS